MSLKKYKSQCKDVEVTLNSKKENSYNFCLDIVQEFGCRSNSYFCSLLRKSQLRTFTISLAVNWLWRRHRPAMWKCCNNHTVANPQRGLVWNVNFLFYPTNISLLLDLFKSPTYMGILILFGTKSKHKENSHVFSINNVAFMEYFLP